MAEPQIESAGGGRYRVDGALTFATVRNALRIGAPQFDAAELTEIDLSGVSSADSAGLALLVEWYRQAARANRSIRFVNVPEQLRALAKISELDRLLALEGGASA